MGYINTSAMEDDLQALRGRSREYVDMLRAFRDDLPLGSNTRFRIGLALEQAERSHRNIEFAETVLLRNRVA